MTIAQWPRYKGKMKANKPDKGVLPTVEHLPINFKADKGHPVHNDAKYFFVMLLKPKKDKKSCTNG
jgi:hypothetical protein